MKRMNNKGFAISTVIYGLSIMSILIVSILMGTMSSTRSNSRKLSKTIEEELNRYSKTDTSFKASTASTPEAQEYIVPTGQSGWYRIELWGAQGGNNGGLGAYTSGIIKLNEGDILYFYVGKKDKLLKRSIAGQCLIDDKLYNSVTDIKNLRINEVTDSDVARPNLTGYTIVEE